MSRDGIFLFGGEPDLAEDFARMCSLHPITGSNIHTLWNCYGGQAPEIQLWLYYQAGEPVAVISSNGVRMEVSAADEIESLAELEEFLRIFGAGRLVQLSSCLFSRLNVRCFGWQEYVVMSLDTPPLEAAAEFEDIDSSPPLACIYALFCSAFPGFDEASSWPAWYTHTSHLFRHGLGYALALSAGPDNLAATAGVYSRGPLVDVIGGVATASQHLGKGYASRLVRCLTKQILDRQRLPTLYCKPELLEFYRRIGFAPLPSQALLRIQL